MAFGVDKPTGFSDKDSFGFQEWCDTIRKYVWALTKIKNTTAAETVESLIFYERVS